MNNLYKKMLMCVSPYIAEYFYVLRFSIICILLFSEWKTV